MLFESSILIVGVIFLKFCLTKEHTHNGMELSAEKRLIKQLMDNSSVYGLYGRPIKSMMKKLIVQYGISLIQIMNVDAQDQVLTTNVWCKYKWKDESLQWNPIQHENVTVVRVPISSVWKPDFVLYNYADERMTEHRHVMAVLYPDGNVTYMPPAIFKSTCAIDTTNFPFDEQMCHLKFGSWTYHGHALDPFFVDDKEFIELSDYMPSKEWIILEHFAKKNVKYYACCPEPFPDLTFYLKVRRRATFYSYTLILPCVLLSLITMVTFMLPPETPAKMLLGINVYIAFFMLLLLLRECTPPTSKRIPILGAYYCFNMIMTTISTFLCAILVDMHYRADKRSQPGRWLTFVVIELIGRGMFLHVPPNICAVINAQKMVKKYRIIVSKQPGTTRQSAEVKLKLLEIVSPFPESPNHMEKCNYLLSPGLSTKAEPIIKKLQQQVERLEHAASKLSTIAPETTATELRLIHDMVSSFILKLREKEMAKNNAETWRMISMVLDRLFLYGYVIAMIISLTTLFPQRPPELSELPRFPNGTLLPQTDDVRIALLQQEDYR